MAKIESLEDICSRFICRTVKLCVTEDAVSRGSKILEKKDRNKFLHVKQKLLAKIIDETRLEVNTDFPLNYFEKTATTLKMRGASKLSDNFLSSICAYIDSILYLDLANCSFITNFGVGLAIESNSQLVELYLENCRRIDDDVIPYLLLAPDLEKISLAGNFNVSTEGIVKLCNEHPNRENFTLLNISGIDYEQEALDTIQRSCPNLISLSVGYNDQEWMTADYFTPVLSSLDLKVLHVHWCKNLVNDSFLEFLAYNCPSLEELDVCGIKTVNAEGIVRLIEGRISRSQQTNLINNTMTLEEEVNNNTNNNSNNSNNSNSNNSNNNNDNDLGNVNTNTSTVEGATMVKSNKALTPFKVMKIIFIGCSKKALGQIYDKYEARIRFIKK